MGLGERCDEIVRLIDETLAAYGALGTEPGATAVGGPEATVTPLPPSRPGPDRTASGF
jgi:hypothetical protein